ncbi:MAG: YhcH/YjgK/YiaL family protein [Saprospiraceae bacterium]|nr:YhcH/YjgK/YiaL family protein [Saprospiraceae bacterium]
MVIDKIENCKLYQGLGKRIAKAFEYINETDLSQTPVGNYEIDGENLFALVQQYETKDIEVAKPEGHHKYIDIQYIISGVELIGLATLRDQIPILSKKEDDYDLYDCDTTLFRMDSGMFSIFFPKDIHMSGIKMKQSSIVKKVVIKVKI